MRSFGLHQIEHHAAECTDSGGHAAVVYIKIGCVVWWCFSGIISLWHTAQVEEYSRGFGSVVRKIFCTGGPDACCCISLTGSPF